MVGNRDFATLSGLAVGDALGMPFEQKDSGHPSLASWDGSFRDCPDDHPFCRGLKAGQWTDDTHMAGALATSLLEAGTYSPVHAASKYLAWYRSKDWRGIGTATKDAMRELDGGTVWTRSGTKKAEGNGSAMRIAPVGLFFHRESPDVIAECARMDARITHDSHEAMEGSVVVALAVAYLAQGGLVQDIPAFLDKGARSSEVLRRSTDAISRANALPPGIPAGKKVAVLANVVGTSGHVVETVPAALFCLAATSGFREAVELAVRAGGDADTTAAVAGAMAGTLYRREAVMPYLRELERAQHLCLIESELARGPRLK